MATPPLGKCGQLHSVMLQECNRAKVNLCRTSSVQLHAVFVLNYSLVYLVGAGLLGLAVGVSCSEVVHVREPGETGCEPPHIVGTL